MPTPPAPDGHAMPTPPAPDGHDPHASRPVDPGAPPDGASPGPHRAPAEPAEPALAQPVEPAPAQPADDGFAGLALATGLLDTLAGLGYEEPTPIQREAIPPLLEGRDVLGEAPTGTGKTAAFSLPLLQRLLGPDGPAEARPGWRRGAARGLVLVPTRELAMQVSEALHRYGSSFGARVLPVYGGQPIGQQLRALERGVDIVVATPGRAVDHLTRGSLSLEHVSMVVLDEADEMLDMGFAEDLETILAAVPQERQTALFSATISPAIAAIARRHLREPVRVRVRQARSESGAAVSTIRQVAYVVRRADKLAALCRVLDVEDPASALVFGRTRGEVDELAERLSGRGHDAAALHGGMSQDQRDRVMGRFRDGALDVLVATDVAARGLDIEHVSHVVNFDVPHDIDQYVHRIGRTGRAGRDGVAITLLEPREHRLLRDIERVTGARLELAKVPTVADLRERRLELLRANLREALVQDGLDRFRAVVEPLSEEFDAVDIALAAVALAAGASGGDTADEPEIPTLPLYQTPAARGRAVAARTDAPSARPGGPGGVGPRPPKALDPDWTRSGPGQPGWARLWVGGGRRIGLRPGDLVGAITNEAGIPAAAIGAIAISDGFSLVDVREDAADLVVGALEGAAIRGRRLAVRRDMGHGPDGVSPGRETRPWVRDGRPGGPRPGGYGLGDFGLGGQAPRQGGHGPRQSAHGPRQSAHGPRTGGHGPRTGPWVPGGPRPGPRPGPRHRPTGSSRPPGASGAPDGA